MIYYERACLCIMLSGSAHIKAALSQRLVRTALAVALPVGAVSAIVKIIDEYYHMLHILMPETLIYVTLSSMVTFMLVFRTSQAYNRFAEGCTLVHVMQANFVDVSALLISLSRASKADAASMCEFRRIAVRLISILNALCLLDLGRVELGDISSLASMVIDLPGLDGTTLQMLGRSPCKPMAACQLLQNLVSDSLDSVLQGVPAPLLTRVYQELGSGMIRFHEAQKLVIEPFPFPFGTVAEIILIFHTLYSPFQIAMATKGPFGAFGYTVGFVFVAWSLYGLALELDDPFGTDMNDLDMHAMQKTLNEDLLHLLVSSSADTPSLCQDAQNERTLIEVGCNLKDDDDAVLRRIGNSVTIGQNDFIMPRPTCVYTSNLRHEGTAAPGDKAVLAPNARQRVSKLSTGIPEDAAEAAQDERHMLSERSQGFASGQSHNSSVASDVILELASDLDSGEGPTRDPRCVAFYPACPSSAGSQQDEDGHQLQGCLGSTALDIELANEPGESSFLAAPAGAAWQPTVSSEWPAQANSQPDVGDRFVQGRPVPGVCIEAHCNPCVQVQRDNDEFSPALMMSV